MNVHNIVTPSKGTTSYLSFRDEIITIYFGDKRSKLDIKMISCRKTHIWTCITCDSLSIKKILILSSVIITKAMINYLLILKIIIKII